MKYTIDNDVRSVCDEIIAMNLSPEEWLRHDKKTFWRRSCCCAFVARCSPGGAFYFRVRGFRDLAYEARALTLEEVHDIGAGRLLDLEIQPPSGIHPEDAGMRRVEVDPEVLYNAINDAVNVFVREAIIKRGLISPEAYSNDADMPTLKHRIAEHWAENWRVSWKKDLPAADSLEE